MINISDEDLLTLAQAASKLPHRPHVATIYRWISRGVRGVKLEAARVGGRTVTSVAALQRFSRRLTSLDGNDGDEPDAIPRVNRRVAKAEAELKKAGF